MLFQTKVSGLKMGYLDLGVKFMIPSETLEIDRAGHVRTCISYGVKVTPNSQLWVNFLL